MKKRTVAWSAASLLGCALLGCALLAPLAASAQTHEPVNVAAAADTVIPGEHSEGKPVTIKRAGKAKFHEDVEDVLVHKRQMEVHHQKYLLLLSEAYAPELADEWQAAFEARKQVTDRLDQEWKEAKEELFKQAEPAQHPAPKGEKKRFTVKVAGIGPMMPMMGVFVTKGENEEEIDARVLAHHGLMAEFAQAVEADDAERIAAALEKLLDEYRKTTEQLAQMPKPGDRS